MVLGLGALLPRASPCVCVWVNLFLHARLLMRACVRVCVRLYMCMFVCVHHGLPITFFISFEAFVKSFLGLYDSHTHILS